MPGSRPCSLWLSQKRQVCARRLISSGGLRRDAAIQARNSDQGPQPTPSQLLRFSLTGSTQHLRDFAPKSELDRHLEEVFLEKWPYVNRPLPPWPSVQRKTVATTVETLQRELEHGVENLTDLRALIERNVNTTESGALLQTQCEALGRALERCQRYNSYGEILSAINALVSRLERLKVAVSRDLYFLGIQYACLGFSAPALKHHLHGYRRVDSRRLDLQSSHELVKSLLSSLRSICFEDPGHDTSLMLSLITGENRSPQDSQYTLDDILYWSGNEACPESIETYASLLGKLGSENSLRRLWNRLRQKLSTDQGPQVLDAAYSCVIAFVDAGKPETAAACLKEISQHANNALPAISRTSRITTLLAESNIRAALSELSGEQELTRILEDQLRVIESRLGLKWQEEQSFHSNINDPSCRVTERPLLTIDGESVGFDSAQRLVAEIRALGSSNSRSDLATIADLLNEHEGDEIPLFTQNHETGSLEFAWFPQCSPIEFSDGLTPAGSNASVPRSSSSLGLMRARFDDHGTPLGMERSLHLIQLGYLGMRSASSVTDSDPSHPRPLDEWKDTGHIVAWDRVAGNFLIVFIGKGRGVIDPGLQSPSIQPPSGLGVVSKLVMPDDPRDFKPSITDILFPEKSAGAAYHFDLDSNANLTP